MKTHWLSSVVWILAAAVASFASEPRTTLELKPLPQGAHGQCAHRLGDRLFVFGGYGPQAIAFDSQRGEWAKFPPMTAPKVFFGSVVNAGKIYAIGGDVQDGDEPGLIERFDADRNQWEVLLRSDALPKSHLSTAAVGDKIYVVGGFPLKENSIQVFDLRTRKLAAMTPMPDAKPSDHFHYVATLDDQLHVLGGMRFAEGEIGPRNQHWMWDGKTWQKRAPLPKPSISKFAAYGVLNGKLYIFDGQSGLHHVYDSAADRWSDTPAPIPATRSTPAVVADGNLLHVLGGVDPSQRGPSNTVLTYDASTDRWRTAK